MYKRVVCEPSVCMYVLILRECILKSFLKCFFSQVGSYNIIDILSQPKSCNSPKTWLNTSITKCPVIILFLRRWMETGADCVGWAGAAMCIVHCVHIVQWSVQSVQRRKPVLGGALDSRGQVSCSQPVAACQCSGGARESCEPGDQQRNSETVGRGEGRRKHKAEYSLAAWKRNITHTSPVRNGWEGIIWDMGPVPRYTVVIAGFPSDTRTRTWYSKYSWYQYIRWKFVLSIKQGK